MMMKTAIIGIPVKIGVRNKNWSTHWTMSSGRFNWSRSLVIQYNWSRNCWKTGLKKII